MNALVGVVRSFRRVDWRLLGAAVFVVSLGTVGLVACVADAPPVIGTATPGNRSATVTWSPPITSTPVVAYIVTPHTGGTSLPRVRFESAATTQIVTGLTNGVTYTFTVQAVSSLGARSGASEESNPVTPSGPTAITAGSGQSCALLAGGTPKCWGSNANGQLGNGTTTSSSTPVAVTGIAKNAIAITAGGGHSCALRAGGIVKCWGRGVFGQLGDGTTTSSSTPVTVTGITDATAITAGSNHSCALLAGGTIQCWGWGYSGELGNGTTAPSSTPVTVTGITDATAITAGDHHSCALLAGGTIQCWGDNYFGQLGNGDPDDELAVPPGDSSTPVTVNGITATATAITAGSNHSCALRAGGTIQCWGLEHGSHWAIQIPGIADATAVTAGGAHACALKPSGTINCWNNNAYGQLGNGTTTHSALATVTGITTATAIDVGAWHSCAILADGTIQCWGNNDYGQLGVTPLTDSLVPVLVTGL